MRGEVWECVGMGVWGWFGMRDARCGVLGYLEGERPRELRERVCVGV